MTATAPPRPSAAARNPARTLPHTVLVLLLSGALWFAPRPAVACGALVPDPDSDSVIDGETSVLSWGGSRETITMVDHDVQRTGRRLDHARSGR